MKLTKIKIFNRKFFILLIVLLILFLFFLKFVPKITFFNIKSFEKSIEKNAEIQIPEIQNNQEKIYKNYKYANNSGIIISTKPIISCSWKPDSIDDGWKSCEVIFEIEDKSSIKKILSSPEIELNFKKEDIRNIEIEYSKNYKLDEEEFYEIKNKTLDDKKEILKTIENLTLPAKIKEKKLKKLNKTILSYKKLKIKKRKFENFVKADIVLENISQNFSIQNNSNINESFLKNNSNFNLSQKKENNISNFSTILNNSLSNFSLPNISLEKFPNQSFFKENKSVPEKKAFYNETLPNASSIEEDAFENNSIKNSNSFSEKNNSSNFSISNKSNSKKKINKISTNFTQKITKKSNTSKNKLKKPETNPNSSIKKSEKIVLKANLSKKDISQGNVSLIGKVISAFRKKEISLTTDKPFAIKIKFEIPKYSANSFNFSILEEEFKAKIDPNISSCGTLDIENAVYTLDRDISSDGTCFTITANHVTLDCQNHKIIFANSSSGKGIYSTANFTTIKNCIIEEGNADESSSSNIFLINSHSSTIRDNTFLKKAHSGFTIYLDTSENTKIFNNYFNVLGDSSYGIYSASSSKNSNISENNFSLSGEANIGIYQSDNSDNGIINKNKIESNSSSGYAIFIDSVQNISIKENSVLLEEEGEGIYSEASSKVLISYNNISVFYDNTYAIYNVQSSLFNISKNLILVDGEESYAILLEANSNSNNISSNKINISGTTAEAIEIYDAFNNLVSDNLLYSDSTDSKLLSLNLAANNTFLRNNLTNSGEIGSGIYLLTSRNNFFDNNRIFISGNSGYGLFVGPNTDNYLNNLYITTNATNSKSVYFYIRECNLTLNNSLLNSSYSDIYIDSGITGGNWELINTTYHIKNWSDSAKGNLTVKWYLRVISMHKTNFLSQINVTLRDKLSNTFLKSTNDNGETIILLREYFQNSSNYIEYYTNYTLSASYNGYTLTRKINLTQNKQLILNFYKEDSNPGSGGGGSGGSFISKSCKSKWKCSKWTKCINGIKTRVCLDLNNCKIIKNKPLTKKKCKKSFIKRKTLFDINLNILTKQISKNILSASISLINVGLPGKVNASLIYQIKNLKQEILYEEQETLSVETQENFIKDIDVSKLSPGNYSLWVNLTYKGQIEPAFAHEEFVISKKAESNSRISLFLIITTSFILIYIFVKRIEIFNFLKKAILYIRRNINFN